jgi:glycerol-3-phosphate acyltransferase PlsY
VNILPWIGLAYLVGAIPSSYLVGKYVAGIDLREHGSKNLGATNVYRVLGLKYALPVAVGDIAKGVIPVVLLAPLAGSQAWLPLTMGIAAVVGHVFSIFVGFRGGKGVATAAGVVLALEPVALGITTIAWLLVLASTRFMSLASMSGAITFPIVVWAVHPERRYAVAAGVGLAAFIVFNHRTNIRRLIAGTENRIGWRQRSSVK